MSQHFFTSSGAHLSVTKGMLSSAKDNAVIRSSQSIYIQFFSIGSPLKRFLDDKVLPGSR
jgi:hypothetical protein